VLPANLLTIWARCVASTLVELGVRHVVISPGSRSTPFVIAMLAEPRLECHLVVDERSAGFFALGIARATSKPPALLCTSGSAAAHYLPAVLEADASALPLVIITADRPTEMHQCAAPQTSSHRQFFGGFIREGVDLGVPAASKAAFLSLRRKVAQSYAAATGTFPGPVHINAPAQKPLEPKAASTPDEVALEADVRAWLDGPPARQFVGQLRPADEDVDAVLALLAGERRGVVIAGPTSEPGVRDVLERFAARVGYPLLAETTSQARYGPSADALVRAPHFELAWRCPTGRALLSPRLAVVVGQTPTSAAWERLAGSSETTLVTVSMQPWGDPSSRARCLLRGPIVSSLEAILARMSAPFAPDQTWVDAWRKTEAACATTVDSDLARRGGESEGRAFRTLTQAIPQDAILFTGNSLSIREIDLFGPERADGPLVLSQRGVNGIDGALSGVVGASVATGRPVVAVLGDLTFLHDVGGLAIAKYARAPIVYVVINNGGGRIFDLLPLASVREDMSAWTTPQSYSLGDLARAFGVAHVKSQNDDTLRDALREALLRKSATCIEVVVAGDAARTEQAAILRQLEIELTRIFPNSALS
jgi:2-succinyl-5-enolpyruvyl-6-hydroxy-3-cyclohexene-1-carboxylate synthase